jgi:hypothetical protein
MKQDRPSNDNHGLYEGQMHVLYMRRQSLVKPQAEMLRELLCPVPQRTHGILHPLRKRSLLTFPHVKRVDSTRQYSREADAHGQVFSIPEVKLRASRQTYS